VIYSTTSNETVKKPEKNTSHTLSAISLVFQSLLSAGMFKALLQLQLLRQKALFMFCFLTQPHTSGINYYPKTDSKAVTLLIFFF